MNYELNKAFIKSHLNDDVNKLALSKFPDGVDKQFVIRQIQARQILKKKLPSWSENDEILFPKRLSLEQCSSELTAKYKSTKVREKTRKDVSENLCESEVGLSAKMRESARKDVGENSCESEGELSTKMREGARKDVGGNSCESVRELSTKVREKTRKDVGENSCNLVDRRILVDLTGGMGVDTSFLSDNFDETIYVESQEELCELAEHNFKVLGKNIKVVNAKAEDFLHQCDKVDCIYIDPARRDEHGRKMVSLHDCSPDVAELQDLLFEKSDTILIKLSPMLDIDIIKKELKNVKEIHVVAVKNECKEVLVLCQRTTDNRQQNLSEDTRPCVSTRVVDLHENWNLTFTEEEERNAVVTYADEVGKYLYEPSVACMKAAPFKLLSQRFNVKKLDRNSHLYTSDELVSDFPGRIFEVMNFVPFNKKAKSAIQIPSRSQSPFPAPLKVSVAVRNFPMTAEELRKHLGFKDGDDFYIFGTTMKGDKKVLILSIRN